MIRYKNHQSDEHIKLVKDINYMPQKVDNWIDDQVIADHKKKPQHDSIVV